MNLRKPIVVGRFWANRKGEAVVVQLREFEGVALLDVRKYYTGRDGKMAPTKKGLSITIRRLPELAGALAKAEHKARELGLLK
jgi:hypothetical protein